MRSTARLASLTLADAAGLHVPGVAQLDPFLRSDEQRIRDFFHDQKRADAAVAEALNPELVAAPAERRKKGILRQLAYQFFG